MARRAQLSTDRRQEIAILHKEGYSLRSISAKVNTCRCCNRRQSNASLKPGPIKTESNWVDQKPLQKVQDQYIKLICLCNRRLIAPEISSATGSFAPVSTIKRRFLDAGLKGRYFKYTFAIMSEIRDFYSGRTVLITGATGFLGKVLIEKAFKLYSNLNAKMPNSLKKIVAIEGDLSQPHLGISTSDFETLINVVSIVFHSAATVKFDEPLKTSVEMNMIGTKRVMQLCRKIVNLEAFVHVSTAYCNCDQFNIEEKVYSCSVKPQQLIDSVEWMDNAIIEHVTPMLLNGKPNTYTYTKGLAERMLQDDGSNLPIAIVRPSIIGGSWKEPIPGWVDNYNGPTGIFLAYSKGILRHLLIDVSKRADIIPVDVPVNMMIAIAWHTAKNKTKELTVYNCTSSLSNPITWNNFVKYLRPMSISMPLENVVRTPNSNFTNNKIVNRIGTFIDHQLPAVIMDFFLKVLGKQPRMLTLYKKLHRSLDSLEFFRMNEWNFCTDNSEKLWTTMSEVDRNIFYFKCDDLNWQEYLKNYYLGAKLYVLKEKLNGKPPAQAKHNAFFILAAQEIEQVKQYN
ncbi:Fatty acyl-CoA reductase 1 [Nymphon striatum]|nr:Fatty acyl-CoA reductase 1 [Nymphon striatum]